MLSPDDGHRGQQAVRIVPIAQVVAALLSQRAVTVDVDGRKRRDLLLADDRRRETEFGLVESVAQPGADLVPAREAVAHREQHRGREREVVLQRGAAILESGAPDRCGPRRSDVAVVVRLAQIRDIGGEAGEDLITGRDLVIHAAGELVFVDRTARVAHVIVDARKSRARRVRRRVIGSHVLPHGIDPVSRNHVTGERRAHVGTGVRRVRHRRGRIVNRDQLARVGDVVREVAGPLRGRRYRGREDGSPSPARAFVIEEEECAVLTVVHLGKLDRRPYRPAELVHVEGDLGISGQVVKEVIGPQIAVAQKLEKRTVNGIGATLGGDVEHSATKPAELGGHRVALHFEFDEGIHARHGRDLVVEPGRARRAVDHDLVRVSLASVDGEVCVPGGVHRDVAELPIGGGTADIAGRQFDQPEGTASVQRQAGDLAVVDHLAQRRVGGPEQGCFLGDVDGLVNLAQLQREIQAHGVADVKDDSGPLHGAKTGMLHHDLIGARFQNWNHVVPALGSLGVAVGPGLDVTNGNPGLRHGRSRRVLYHP